MCLQDKYQFMKSHLCSKPAFITGWKHMTLWRLALNLLFQNNSGMVILLQNLFVHFQAIFLLIYNFMLKFKKGKSYLKIANPTSKGLTIKAGTSLWCVSFELIRDLFQCANTITHFHQDMDGRSAMCSLNMSACPINHRLRIDPDIAHSRNCHKPYNHTLQSLDYPTCAESLHMSQKCFHHSY